MSGHIVSAFERELSDLKDRVLQLGLAVLRQVKDVETVLTTGDPNLAHSLIEGDRAIDAEERAIEASALRLLALRRPAGDDFRLAVCAMQVARALERIGDVVKNIAKRERLHTDADRSILGTAAAALCRIVGERLEAVLEAYGLGSVDRAMDIWRADREVDAGADALHDDALSGMGAPDATLPYLGHMLFVAKNLERIGDQATNIAECVRFESTGEQTLESRPKVGAV